MKNTNERIAVFKAKTSSLCLTVVLLVWSIISFSGVSTFIYVGF
jgi:hypothetical protein